MEVKLSPSYCSKKPFILIKFEVRRSSKKQFILIKFLKFHYKEDAYLLHRKPRERDSYGFCF